MPAAVAKLGPRRAGVDLARHILPRWTAATRAGPRTRAPTGLCAASTRLPTPPRAVSMRASSFGRLQRHPLPPKTGVLQRRPRRATWPGQSCDVQWSLTPCFDDRTDYDDRSIACECDPSTTFQGCRTVAAMPLTTAPSSSSTRRPRASPRQTALV